VSQLLNLSPFEAKYLPSMDRHDEDLALVVMAGRFAMPPAGKPCVEVLSASEEQPPVQLADEYWGDPEASSLRYEGQSHRAPLATTPLIWRHLRRVVDAVTGATLARGPRRTVLPSSVSGAMRHATSARR